MPAKTFTGARAKIYVDGQLVGLFDSCSYSVNVGAEPIHILGRFGPAEIVPTSYEAVTVNCTGFRIIGNGAHVLPKFPKLQDLLNLEGISLQVVDRQAPPNSEPILTVEGCVPVSYSSAPAARGTTRIQITYVGLKAQDEDGAQNESAGASELP